MRIYNPGPEISVIHGRSMLTPQESAKREARVEKGENPPLRVSQAAGFTVPAHTALDVPGQVGEILLRAHAKDCVVRIDRPTTEAKQIGAADRAYALKFGASPVVLQAEPEAAEPEPEPSAEQEPEPQAEPEPEEPKAAEASPENDDQA